MCLFKKKNIYIYKVFTSNIGVIIVKAKVACNRNDDLCLLWFSAFKNTVGFVRDGLFW